MSAEKGSQRDPRYDGFRLVLALSALMWVSEIVDTIVNHHLDRYGIEPHSADGLTGIITAPFLHAGFDHLISNTIPFLLLGFAIALGGAVRVALVTAIVMGVGGLGTWVFASSGTDHIGASGVVFGYASYLVSPGIFNRSLLELAMGAVVVAIWGGALLSGLAPQEGISWQGHLFGAIGGIVAARVLDARATRPPSRAAS